MAQPGPVLGVERHQLLDRGEVFGEALSDGLLDHVLGRGDLHGPIERQSPGRHLAKGLHRLRGAVVALQHALAEVHAGELDLLGERDLLRPGEQRDLAHLGEVHADGIVNAARAGLFNGLFEIDLLLFLLGLLASRVLGVLAHAGTVGLGLIEHLDTGLLKPHHYDFELVGRDGLVREDVVHLFPGQVTATLGQLQQRLDRSLDRIGTELRHVHRIVHSVRHASPPARPAGSERPCRGVFRPTRRFLPPLPFP